MTSPPRTALSRELIARTALAMTDERGLGGLSMRKLGGALGVEAMSLYHYINNKDDLLDAVLDCLFTEIDLPVDVPDEDWETATRRGLRSFHDVLVNHAAGLELFSTRPASTPEAFRVLMWAYGRFSAVGLDADEASRALQFGVSFVMGHVAVELGALGVSSEVIVVDLDEIDDPAMIEFIKTRPSISSNEMFESGMDAVIAGLRATYHLP